MKKMIFITGSSYSGKSSFGRKMLKLKPYRSFKYIDSQEIRQKYLPQDNPFVDVCCDELAYLSILELVKNKDSFIYERCPTNYNRLHYLQKLANENNYKLITFFLGTNTVETNINRSTIQGVGECEKIKDKYKLTEKNLYQLICISDIIFFIDNSDNGQFKLVSKYSKNVFFIYEKCDWFEKCIKNKIINSRKKSNNFK